MAATDDRLKVRHQDGRVGAVERIVTKAMCTVQFRKHGYYEMCRIDDLLPIDDLEFDRRFK